jgi:DNA-binding NtrC family response regulator
MIERYSKNNLTLTVPKFKMSSRKILILEEDHHLQWVMKTYLESKGFSAVVADSGVKAVEMASKDKFSIFITEYWIDHSNTLGIIKKLKAMTPRIYVLLNTYRVIDEREHQSIMEAGVDDLFEKPFSLEKMIIHLKEGPSKKRSNSLGREPNKISSKPGPTQ